MNYSDWLKKELEGTKVGLLQPTTSVQPYDTIVGIASRKAMRLWTLRTKSLVLLGEMVSEIGRATPDEGRILMDTIRTYGEDLEKQNVQDHPQLIGKKIFTIRRGWKVVWIDEMRMHQHLKMS